MKILISKPDAIVLQLNVVSVDQNNAQGDNWIDATVNSDNSEIVEASECPFVWQRGLYTFIGGTWDYVDSTAQTAANALKDEKLSSEREAIWTLIKSYRDNLIQNGGYLASGKWFHSDTLSRTQQMGLVMMGASVPAVQWKTMDGTFITMTQTLAGQIFAAAAMQDQALFSHAELLHATVLAAEDPNSVDITVGWPSTYVSA